MTQDVEKTTTREPTRQESQVDVRQRGGEPTRARPVFVPPADIYETDDAIVVKLDMPGVVRDDIDVTLENGVLIIRGETARDEHKGYRQVYAEYEAGGFERVFTLSEAIDPEKIDAELKDGVLTLHLPKTESAKVRRIQIKS